MADVEYPYESLQELWRIVEMRDGAVYETEYIEDRWRGFGPGPKDREPAPEGYVWASKRDAPIPRRRAT